MLSDYKFALAAISPSAEPILRIRFIPNAHARFAKFMMDSEDRRGSSI
jgi:hypothetical protein